jgi:molybdate/tungstate transport system ATP-binding protein
MVMTLQIKDLSLKAGSFQIDVADLEINTGEYFVMMGPTGSGKSLLLKAICGLHRIEKGTITIAGKDVTELPPKDRKLGYVPQNSNLFPNLDVRHNILFPFDVRGIPRSQSKEKVSEIAEMLHLEELLERQTIHLSGGERQKVALARALAAEPDILLLDEPVSAVDEPTRREICSDLLTVQSNLKLSTIHVCHSLEEAKSVSDRVGIMSKGKLCTTGTLDEIIRSNPENPDIRRLLSL